MTILTVFCERTTSAKPEQTVSPQDQIEKPRSLTRTPGQCGQLICQPKSWFSISVKAWLNGGSGGETWQGITVFVPDDTANEIGAIYAVL